jgi:hypothetical protein
MQGRMRHCWKPRLGFRELIEMMVGADLEIEKRADEVG